MSAPASAERPLWPRRVLRKLHHARYEWGPVLAPRHQARLANVAVRNALHRRAYRELSATELRATRRSDTVFIFGSGRTLLDITGDEWDRIAAHQTIAYGEFHRERLVRIDYHLINEVADPEAYTRSIRENPTYDDAIFVVQGGWMAYRGNELIGRRLLPAGRRVYRYRRYARWQYADPSDSLRRGLVHGPNSVVDAANLALLLGWTRIVFAGVDLFDRQYFYLPAGETTAGQGDPNRRFQGADETVELFRRWRPIAERRGVALRVYSERSLLSECLDVFSWDEA